MARNLSSATYVTAVLHFLQAYNAGNLDELESSLDPQVEWHSAAEYRGRAAVREYLEMFRSRFSSPQARPEDFRAADDHVLMVICFFEGDPGEEPVADQRQSWVADVGHDGKLRRVVAYPTPAEAARALQAMTRKVHA
jgi:ketosteroid isomerase-like protein